VFVRFRQEILAAGVCATASRESSRPTETRSRRAAADSPGTTARHPPSAVRLRASEAQRARLDRRVRGSAASATVVADPLRRPNGGWRSRSRVVVLRWGFGGRIDEPSRGASGFRRKEPRPPWGSFTSQPRARRSQPGQADPARGVWRPVGSHRRGCQSPNDTSREHARLEQADPLAAMWAFQDPVVATHPGRW
jgi:hypothetical protein